jgi:hypothetical protein
MGYFNDNEFWDDLDQTSLRSNFSAGRKKKQRVHSRNPLLMASVPEEFSLDGRIVAFSGLVVAAAEVGVNF